MMVLDGFRPLTEPACDRSDHAETMDRVLADRVPLVVVEGAVLVQDLPGDLELADVVEECGPAKPVPITLREPQLLCDHVHVGANTLGVSASLAVVAAERRREREDEFRCLRGGSIASGLDRGDAAFQLRHRTRSAGDPESGGGLVGEEHAHLEERRERKEAPGEAIHDRRRSRGDRDGHDPPEHHL